MNFQQLEYILAVHRQGHFGKAAESCDITQATLSAMIKRLESELGLVLFDRTRHPIQTTDKGLVVVQKAEQLLTIKNQLLNLKNMESNELSGKLHLGIIPTVATSLLPLILPKIMELNPSLELSISEITTEEILSQLASRQIDLGILSTPLDSIQEGIEEEILYYESMMVYGVTDQKKRFVTTADVKDSQVWLLEEGHCFRSQSITICDIKEKKDGSNKLNFKGNSFDTLINLTDQFGGFTLVPELYVHHMSSARKKRTKSFQSPIPVREISLVGRKPIIKQQAMNIVSDLIRSIVPQQLITSGYANNELDIIAF